MFHKKYFKEVVLDLIKEAMLKEFAKGSHGFLIDGYPREVKQGDQFESEVSKVFLFNNTVLIKLLNIFW